jgi:hypothetical protein
MPTARWPTAGFTPPALRRRRRAGAAPWPTPAATHLVTDILADNNARVRTFGSTARCARAASRR